MLLKYLNQIKKRTHTIHYGSLDNISTKIARDGKVFYVFALSSRKQASIEVYLMDEIFYGDIKKFYTRYVNRVKLEIIPFNHYSRKRPSFKHWFAYLKRERNTCKKLKESSFKIIGGGELF